MNELRDALAAQHAELAALIDPLSETQWRLPTRCEGWDIADVVVHLHQTDVLGLASLRGELTPDLESFMRAGGEGAIDDAAAASVAGERGASGADVAARWNASAAELRTEFATVDPSARLQWVVGTLSARTLAATRLAECWIHSGDVADALGIALVPADRLRHVARLAWRTLPYAFERSGEDLSGAVAFDLVGPTGAPWRFGTDVEAPTVVRGPGVDLCDVAGRRKAPGDTALVATGPDAAAVLRLVRTYA
ncbi:MAG: maleylpyruvate isomerase family mycothiol-dependent enzyme [Acidimicrobiia bacterium]|nr:maleylpyruvate isomerase family mycothiol-dependent enzyme [Acidimicrobiia bacterium]